MTSAISSLAYETGTGDVAGAVGRAGAEGQAAFGCRRTRSAVSCPRAFGLCSGSMWLSPSIVATSGLGSSSWSLLLTYLACLNPYARELMVSAATTVLTVALLGGSR